MKSNVSSLSMLGKSVTLSPPKPKKEKRPNTQFVSPSKEEQLLIQEGGCWYCNLKLCVGKEKTSEFNYATWEHIVPRKRRGGSLPNNKVLACAYCNNEKGSMSLEEYRAILKTKGIVSIWGDVIERRRTRQQYDTENPKRGTPDNHTDCRCIDNRSGGCGVLSSQGELLLPSSQGEAANQVVGKVPIPHRQQSWTRQWMDNAGLRQGDGLTIKHIAVTTAICLITVNGGPTLGIVLASGIYLGIMLAKNQD